MSIAPTPTVIILAEQQDLLSFCLDPQTQANLRNNDIIINDGIQDYSGDSAINLLKTTAEFLLLRRIAGI